MMSLFESKLCIFSFQFMESRAPLESFIAELLLYLFLCLACFDAAKKHRIDTHRHGDIFIIIF